MLSHLPEMILTAMCAAGACVMGAGEVISDSTAVSIGLLVIIVGVVGFIFTIRGQSKENEKSIKAMWPKMDKMADDISQIKVNCARNARTDSCREPK